MVSDRERLLKQFDVAMFNIYRDAKVKAKYNATLFLQMLSEHGGYDTALRLIRSERPSDGYTALFERGQLELTVEALVIKTPWNSLFIESDLTKAAGRLKQYKYKFEESR